MAKGVDSYAHTVAINNDGYTVAIVGNGLDICYPSKHDKLMQKIQNKGLLLSEYPPGTIPARYRFPQRNCLISAWSDEIVVIGGRKSSGASRWKNRVCFERWDGVGAENLRWSGVQNALPLLGGCALYHL